MSTPRMITHNGRTMSVGAWAKELGISAATLYARIKACEERGAPLDPAFQAGLRRVTAKQIHKRPKEARWITHNGRTMTAPEWAAELDIPLKTIYMRLVRFGPEATDRILAPPIPRGTRSHEGMIARDMALQEAATSIVHTASRLSLGRFLPGDPVFERCLVLLALLLAHDGLSAPDLAERLGTDRQQVYKALNRLRKAGVPVHNAAESSRAESRRIVLAP